MFTEDLTVWLHGIKSDTQSTFWLLHMLQKLHNSDNIYHWYWWLTISKTIHDDVHVYRQHVSAENVCNSPNTKYVWRRQKAFLFTPSCGIYDQIFSNSYSCICTQNCFHLKDYNTCIILLNERCYRPTLRPINIQGHLELITEDSVTAFIEAVTGLQNMVWCVFI